MKQIISEADNKQTQKPSAVGMALALMIFGGIIIIVPVIIVCGLGNVAAQAPHAQTPHEGVYDMALLVNNTTEIIPPIPQYFMGENEITINNVSNGSYWIRVHTTIPETTIHVKEVYKFVKTTYTDKFGKVESEFKDGEKYLGVSNRMTDQNESLAVDSSMFNPEIILHGNDIPTKSDHDKGIDYATITVKKY